MKKAEFCDRGIRILSVPSESYFCNDHLGISLLKTSLDIFAKNLEKFMSTSIFSLFEGYIPTLYVQNVKICEKISTIAWQLSESVVANNKINCHEFVTHCKALSVTWYFKVQAPLESSKGDILTLFSPYKKVF